MTSLESNRLIEFFERKQFTLAKNIVVKTIDVSVKSCPQNSQIKKWFNNSKINKDLWSLVHCYTMASCLVLRVALQRLNSFSIWLSLQRTRKIIFRIHTHEQAGFVFFIVSLVQFLHYCEYDHLGSVTLIGQYSLKD